MRVAQRAHHGHLADEAPEVALRAAAERLLHRDGGAVVGRPVHHAEPAAARHALQDELLRVDARRQRREGHALPHERGRHLGEEGEEPLLRRGDLLPRREEVHAAQILDAVAEQVAR